MTFYIGVVELNANVFYFMNQSKYELVCNIIWQISKSAIHTLQHYTTISSTPFTSITQSILQPMNHVMLALPHRLYPTHLPAMRDLTQPCILYISIWTIIYHSVVCYVCILCYLWWMMKNTMRKCNSFIVSFLWL